VRERRGVEREKRRGGKRKREEISWAQDVSCLRGLQF